MCFINDKKIPIIVLIIINKVLTYNEIKIIITKEGIDTHRRVCPYRYSRRKVHLR